MVWGVTKMEKAGFDTLILALRSYDALRAVDSLQGENIVNPNNFNFDYRVGN